MAWVRPGTVSPPIPSSSSLTLARSSAPGRHGPVRQTRELDGAEPDLLNETGSMDDDEKLTFNDLVWWMMIALAVVLLCRLLNLAST